MKRIWRGTFAKVGLGCASVLALVCGALSIDRWAGVAQPLDSDLYELDGRRSGFLYMSDGLQELQEDGFLNPGRAALDRGRAAWNRQDGSEGMSCASCHGDAAESMKGVGARYPVYDEELDRLVNLPQRINLERQSRMGAEALELEGQPLLELTTFVAHQSHGMPMRVDVSGPAQPAFERGRDLYNTRMGQLNLACTHCHDRLDGEMLRGDVISQGQINGFPIFRLMWDSVASRHRMFEWCNTSLRAEPFSYGSEEYMALELYLAWRGRGLPVEAPAVRR